MTLNFATARSQPIVVLPPLMEPSVADEGNHRIANNLQLLAGMVAIEARRIQDPTARKAFEATLLRINALGSVHRQLYFSRNAERVDLQAYLVELGVQLQQGVGNDQLGRTVMVHADVVEVVAEAATSIGVIVSELVSNAFKHAYPLEQPGVVSITLRGKDRGYELEVRDRGCGVVPGKAAAGSGLGLRLVAMMAKRLGSQLRWSDANPGTVFTLRVEPF